MQVSTAVFSLLAAASINNGYFVAWRQISTGGQDRTRLARYVSIFSRLLGWRCPRQQAAIQRVRDRCGRRRRPARLADHQTRPVRRRRDRGRQVGSSSNRAVAVRSGVDIFNARDHARSPVDDDIVQSAMFSRQRSVLANVRSLIDNTTVVVEDRSIGVIGTLAPAGNARAHQPAVMPATCVAADKSVRQLVVPA